MGKSGVSFDYVKKSAAIGNDLTDAQKELAYNAGKESADVEARNNYLRNVLQSKKKGGTINENDIDGGINNAEQRAEQKAENEGKSESRIAGSNERALSEDGNGRGVSEENGENRQSSEQIVHLQSGRRGLNQTEKRFSEDSFIVPREGTVEAEEYRKLSEYGIEGYVVKKSAWDRNVQAFSRGGKIYIRDELDEIYRGIAVPHEATHVMKHLRYQPYLDFIDRTPLMLNMASDIAKSLINAPATHYNIDIFDMNERQRILIYDEINATAYGSYVGGQIVGELKEQINDAFYDFDAYINELSAIHEQFKKENTSARPEPKKTVRRRGFVKSEGVKLSELKKAFNDTHNKAYKILDTIARVTGVNIVLYKSDVDADGNFIGKQGKFKWGNDTIYIDINAGLENNYDVGDLAKYTMLRTFSHEFSHFIEKWNPIQYNELRRAIFNELTARGADVDDLITNKLAEDSTGKMTYEEASREVVAESLTDILPDSSFIETLANKHKNVFNKLLSKLREFIADIKAYFKRIGSEQVEEANKLKEEMNGALHYVESIVKLFDKAAVDAVENYQAATPKTDADGKVQNQERPGSAKKANETKITAGMSDSERAEILKNKVINAPMYEGQADALIAEKKTELEIQKKKFGKDTVVEIAEKLEIPGTIIKFEEVDVQVLLSKGNIEESITKEATPEQIAKLLPILPATAKDSVVIERHNNRYYYDTDTMYFDNLLGAYIDGDNLIPIRFGLKYSRTGNTTLYVVVNQNEIAISNLVETKKDRGHSDPSPDLTESGNPLRSVTYSISQIIPFVNSKDLLRYIPDDFLNTEQLKAKREAVAETEKYTYHQTPISAEQTSVPHGNLQKNKSTA